MISLLNEYYSIDSRTVEGDDTLFGITLLPDYCAYEGHFPGNPVSPGVCNIQMIKECAVLLTGKQLFLGTISQCKWSAVMSPQTTPHLQLRMHVNQTEGSYKVNASIYDSATIYIEFKGEMTLLT
jgi:3-hydroxyacyl-[acyl-carrier-protein] dehydratase